jgi:hypothetical protein
VVPFVVPVEKPRKDDTTAHPARQQFFIQNQMRRRRAVTQARLRVTLRLSIASKNFGRFGRTGHIERKSAEKCGHCKAHTLGAPAPNAPKWFCAVEVICLAVDQEWLHKATKEISKHWRQKRERSQFSRSSLNMTQRQAA